MGACAVARNRRFASRRTVGYTHPNLGHTGICVGGGGGNTHLRLDGHPRDINGLRCVSRFIALFGEAQGGTCCRLEGCQIGEIGLSGFADDSLRDLGGNRPVNGIPEGLQPGWQETEQRDQCEGDDSHGDRHLNEAEPASRALGGSSKRTGGWCFHDWGNG